MKGIQSKNSVHCFCMCNTYRWHRSSWGMAFLWQCIHLQLHKFCTGRHCDWWSSVQHTAAGNPARLSHWILLPSAITTTITMIIIIINYSWVVTQWQWLFYMHTKHEIVAVEENRKKFWILVRFRAIFARGHGSPPPTFTCCLIYVCAFSGLFSGNTRMWRSVIEWVVIDLSNK